MLGLERSVAGQGALVWARPGAYHHIAVEGSRQLRASELFRQASHRFVQLETLNPSGENSTELRRELIQKLIADMTELRTIYEGAPARDEFSDPEQQRRWQSTLQSHLPAPPAAPAEEAILDPSVGTAQAIAALDDSLAHAEAALRLAQVNEVTQLQKELNQARLGLLRLSRVKSQS